MEGNETLYSQVWNCHYTVIIIQSYSVFWLQEARGDASSSEDEARGKDYRASESETESSEEESETEAILS